MGQPFLFMRINYASVLYGVFGLEFYYEAYLDGGFGYADFAVNADVFGEIHACAYGEVGTHVEEAIDVAGLTVGIATGVAVIVVSVTKADTGVWVETVAVTKVEVETGQETKCLIINT